jgi:hypothetical protein
MKKRIVFVLLWMLIGCALFAQSAINNVIPCTYPNPATTGFYINAGETVATVSIYTLSGTLLLTKQVTGKDYVPVDGLAKGTYLVKIVSPQGVLNQKLIIK